MFLEVHTVMVAEFYGVMYAMDEAQKMGITNVWFECVFSLVCGGIFRGSMEEFIGGFSAFLEVQIVCVAEFYGVMYAMEEAQKMEEAQSFYC